MPRPSFSTQLYALWILVAILCSLLTATVWLMLSSALGERVAAAKQQAIATCTAVAWRYDLSIQRPGEAHVDLMHAVLDLVLIRTEGIEGGFWTSAPAPGAADGFLAYAFPTYEGSGVKRDIPEAETPLILRTLRSVSGGGQMRADVVSSGADAVIAVACLGPERLIDTLLIGVDLGPNLSITGSLATILWLLSIRREGEEVGFMQFFRIGTVVMLPALVLAMGARLLVGH